MASKATDISLQGVSNRINGRHAFVHERVLELIARGTTEDGSISFRKGDLAVRLGCCDQSLDRALTRLRREGYVISEPSFDSNGGQFGNVYRVTEAGRARVNGLHGSGTTTQANLSSGANA